GVVRAPEVGEAPIVLAAAERARPVPGGERRRLVEEEQLGEAARLQQRRPAPAAKLELARDPAPHGEAAADRAGRVVQAAAVAVDEPALGRLDQLAERRDAILTRHHASVPAAALSTKAVERDRLGRPTDGRDVSATATGSRNDGTAPARAGLVLVSL